MANFVDGEVSQLLEASGDVDIDLENVSCESPTIFLISGWRKRQLEAVRMQEARDALEREVKAYLDFRIPHEVTVHLESWTSINFALILHISANSYCSHCDRCKVCGSHKYARVFLRVKVAIFIQFSGF